jgi:ankyrin repeat protein
MTLLNDLYTMCIEGDVRSVELLCNAYKDEIDINEHVTRFLLDDTIVHAVCELGSREKLKCIFKYFQDKIDVNNTTYGGETLLHRACRAGKLEIVEELCSRFQDKIEVNKLSNEEGGEMSALTMACKAGHRDIVYYLCKTFKSTIDYEQACRYGRHSHKSFLYLMCQLGYVETVEFLCEEFGEDVLNLEH